MMTRQKNQQIEMHLITIEDLVPDNHLLRKVSDIMDFSFAYDEVEAMYCSNNGRPLSAHRFSLQHQFRTKNI